MATIRLRSNAKIQQLLCGLAAAQLARRRAAVSCDGRRQIKNRVAGPKSGPCATGTGIMAQAGPGCRAVL